MIMPTEKKRWVALRSPILRLLRLLLGVLGLIVVTISSSSAQPNISISSFGVCTSIQAAVRKLPKNVGLTEWPLALHIKKMQFPVWKEINPSDYLGVIEENYLQEQAATNAYLEATAPTGTLHKNMLLTPEEADRGWNKFSKPAYIDAIKSNELNFQQSSLSSDELGRKDIIMFRFRIMSRHNATIARDQSSPTENWHYILRQLGQHGTFKDYPVMFASEPLMGELAVIDGFMILFATEVKNPTYAAQIYLPPGLPWAPSGGVALLAACTLKIPD